MSALRIERGDAREKLTTATERRQLPVRLTELRLDVRCQAARAAGRTEPEEVRADLLAVALAPSDTVYYVAASARPLLARFAA